MNWGRGIALALGVFIIFIVILATIMMTSNVDLESEDYYQQEIAYQDEIDAQRNANNLTEKVEVTDHEDHIMVSIPDSLNCEELNVEFRRPNNDKLDRSFQPDNSKTILIEKKELQAGLYNLFISYKVDGELYLQKSNITVK